MAGITDLLSGLLGKSSKKKLIDQLSGLMGEGSPIGGLQGLLGKFEASGLTEQTKSWVAKDVNKPVSAAEVKKALGDDQVQQIASRAGVSTDEAADGLAGLLPDFVDKLTPDGAVPDSAQLQKLVGTVGKLLK